MLYAPGRLLSPIAGGVAATLDLNFMTGSLPAGITFTRASTAWAYNSSGVLTSYATNAARFDYAPVALTARGLLIEEARTNLMLQSQTFDNASWTKTSSSITANAATALDGTVTADKLIEAAATASHLARQTITLSATTYTASVYAKAVERSVFTIVCLDGTAAAFRSAHFNLAAGTASTGGTGLAGSHAIEAVGNGWYRCTVVFTTTSGGAGSYVDFRLSSVTNPASSGDNYAGDGTSGLYLWGAQVEAGSFVTSYMGATVGSTVTRAADVCTMLTSAITGFSAATGTLLVEAAGSPASVAATYAVLDDGGTTNCLRIARTTTQQQGLVNSGGGAVATFNSTLVASGVAFKAALAWAVNDFNAAVNGTVNTPDTAGAVPVAPTTLRIGERNGTQDVCNAPIRRVRYWNTRLPDATLQGITS